jgi:hypothetical protein
VKEEGSGLQSSQIIHQMWDEMVIMLVIKKDNRMMTTSKVVQTNVEGSLVIRAPKNKYKGGHNRGKKRKDD